MNYLIHQVKKPIEFLSAFIERFGHGATLSMEGDLSKVDLPSLLPVMSRKPTKLLPSQSNLTSDNQFVVIPLDVKVIPILCDQVLPRIGLKRHVAHVQISVGERRIFAAYDNFADECVWVVIPDDDGMLSKLKSIDVIGHYARNPYVKDNSSI